MLFVSLNSFDFFFTLQPLGLIFLWLLVLGSLALVCWREGQAHATIRPSHQPHPPPFPFSSYSGFSGHCNLILPSEHKSRGHSSRIFEKWGLCGAFPRGCMGKEGERGIKRKFHVVPLITGWKERGESSNRAPQARPGSQL